MQEDTEEDAEPAPPPIATRPERTKSIYTKPVDSDEETTPSLKLPPTINENDLYDKSSEKSNNNHSSSTAKTEPPKSGTPREKKKKMTDEEILAKLRQIVSIGDPNRKYTKMEKILAALLLLPLAMVGLPPQRLVGQNYEIVWLYENTECWT